MLFIFRFLKGLDPPAREKQRALAQKEGMEKSEIDLLFDHPRLSPFKYKKKKFDDLKKFSEYADLEEDSDASSLVALILR